MSVPHLDTRVIGGQHSLLFGPYAGFSSKFLKHGSLLDLFESVRAANIKPLLSVARDNFDLTEYLIRQVLQSESHRLASLDQYFPNAKSDDWKLQIAGQRVEIIKPTSNAAACWNWELNSSLRRTVRLLRYWALLLEHRPQLSSRSAFWKNAFPMN
jgi:L-2-hydroxyglutarate oxidase LhgO